MTFDDVIHQSLVVSECEGRTDGGREAFYMDGNDSTALIAVHQR